MKVDQNPFPAHTHVLELSNPKVLIRPNQAESTKGKNIIIGEERSEPSKSHQETPAKKVSEDSLKNSALGGQEQKKDARSTQTGLTSLKTGPSVISKKNSKTTKRRGRVSSNSWPSTRRKELLRNRTSDQIKLKIQIHQRSIVSNRLLMCER